MDKRNTDKVDLQKGVIELVGRIQEVTLQAPHPGQCTKSLRFNHKKDKCSMSVLR